MRQSYETRNFEGCFSRESIAEHFSPSVADNVDPELWKHLAWVFDEYEDQRSQGLSNYFFDPFVLGHFGDDLPLYLRTTADDLAREGSLSVSLHAASRLTFCEDTVQNVLAKHPDHYTMISLSNIPDWLTSDQNRELVQLTFEALQVGGVVLIRTMTNHKRIDQLFANKVMWGSVPVSLDQSLLYTSFAYYKIVNA